MVIALAIDAHHDLDGFYFPGDPPGIDISLFHYIQSVKEFSSLVIRQYIKGQVIASI